MGKKNKQTDRYILAVKNYQQLLKNIDEGTFSLAGKDMAACRKLISSPVNSTDSLLGLKRFMRKVKKGEFKHYWECLINDGYTLMEVEFTDREDVLKNLCDNTYIRYLGEQQSS